MMKLSFSPATATLSGVCLVLSGLLGYEIFSPLPQYEVPKVDRPSVITVPQNTELFVPPPDSRFSEIETRSVFSPARASLAVLVPPKPPRTPPNMSLVGILVAGKQRIAIARMQGAPAAVNLVPGQNIDGWKVKAIRPDSMELEADADTIEIRLQAAPSVQTPNRASPPNIAPASFPSFAYGQNSAAP